MSLFTTSIIPATAALIAVLALILLAGRAARHSGLARFRPSLGTRPQRLTLQDQLPLDRARRLLLVRCDGRDVLLLTGGGTDLLIGWLPEPGAEGHAP